MYTTCPGLPYQEALCCHVSRPHICIDHTCIWGGERYVDTQTQSATSILGDLCARERIVTTMRIYPQALDDAKSPEPKAVAQNGEEAVEEGSGPANFGHDEDNDLEDDE